MPIHRTRAVAYGAAESPVLTKVVPEARQPSSTASLVRASRRTATCRRAALLALLWVVGCAEDPTRVMHIERGGHDTEPIRLTSGDEAEPVQVTIVRVVSGRAYRTGTNGLRGGAPVYIDRAFTYSNVPPLLEGETYILTADEDWNHPGHGNFFRFLIDREAVVYVAFLQGANLPTWLRNNFAATGLSISASQGAESRTFELYSRTYAAGEVVLGSNRPGNSTAMYTVIVKATGDGGDNQPPIAHAGGPYSGVVGAAIQFNGTGSSDPDGDLPLTYAWNFGDGNTGTGATPSHTYAAPGDYTATLVVTDSRGAPSQPATAPVNVSAGTGSFSSISAGFHHTCALTTAGTAYCWGRNDNRGQLGDGTFVNRLTPVRVVGGHSFAVISGGALHTCALTPAGTAYCWGRNNHGQLGNGTTTDTNRPIAVIGGLTFTSISAGEHHSCGLATDGRSYCWGRNNRGQLGNDGTASVNRPTLVAGGFTFAFLRAGYQHSCGLLANGAAYCWGRNQMGQLGDGTTNDRRRPTAVVGGLTFRTLNASQNADGSQHHTCGITTNGLTYCWGDNWHNQLGIGNGIRGFRTTPQRVPNVPTFSGVAAGGDHNCAVTSAGVVWCWGDGLRGGLGSGPTGDYNDPAPIDMSGRDERGFLRTGAFHTLGAGWDHSCGITTSGDAWCWGWNGHGQLGIGHTNNRTRPQRVLLPD